MRVMHKNLTVSVASKDRGENESEEWKRISGIPCVLLQLFQSHRTAAVKMSQFFRLFIADGRGLFYNSVYSST